VFYQDEADIDLNPKIGADWMLKGQQKRIVTLGQPKALSGWRATFGYGTSPLRQRRQ
jgi:hypothetical protein